MKQPVVYTLGFRRVMVIPRNSCTTSQVLFSWRQQLSKIILIQF